MSNLVKPDKNWLTGLENCKDCVRCSTRKQVIPGVGNRKDPKLFFVLDTVSEEENDSEYGTRFSRAGSKYLNDKLGELGVDRWSECYLTSVMKCWRPKSGSAAPIELNQCGKYLDLEIFQAKPKIVVLMGDLAVKYWFRHGSISSLAEGRNKTFETNHQVVIATFNPSDVNEKNQSDWDKDWERIKKAYEQRYSSKING